MSAAWGLYQNSSINKPLRACKRHSLFFCSFQFLNPLLHLLLYSIWTKSQRVLYSFAASFTPSISLSLCYYGILSNTILKKKTKRSTLSKLLLTLSCIMYTRLMTASKRWWTCAAGCTFRFFPSLCLRVVSVTTQLLSWRLYTIHDCVSVFFFVKSITHEHMKVWAVFYENWLRASRVHSRKHAHADRLRPRTDHVCTYTAQWWCGGQLCVRKKHTQSLTHSHKPEGS